MGKTLIIAEKPSVARDLASALGKVKKQKDWYESDEYVIDSAVGHLVELFMPDDIDKKLRFWRLESLPIVPSKFELKPIERSEDKFKQLKKHLKRKDIDLVVNACDAGREGELIFTYVYEAAKSKLPTKRMWMQSMTPTSIREAWENLRDDEVMVPLKDAARSRSEADWLVGINGTRAVTTRMFGSKAKGKVATVGRVQTPTLTIVLNREKEINAFQPRTYWRVLGTFGVTAGSYEGVFQKAGFKKNDDEHDRADRLWTKEEAEAVVEAVQAAGTGEASEKKKRTKNIAPRLFDLTSLQREANGRFGFPAGKTLRVAQSLYEKHKLLTYPRTDSKALPEDYPTTVHETLRNLEGDLGRHADKVIAKGWVNPNDKRIFNNAQVSDHFAIIPTGESMKKLTEDEAKIFDLVARRFIAIFYPPAEFDVTTRLTVVAEHTFKTTGKVLVVPGWLDVYGTQSQEDILTPLSEADRLGTSNADGDPLHKADVNEVFLDEDETRPPPRYTEATLLSAMEGAGKLVTDEDLADAMKEKGLGTPATRAAIIDHLCNEAYLERLGRELAPTGKAEMLIDFLTAVKADALTQPSLTGEWEYRLRQIELGNLSREEFMKGITDMTSGMVQSVKDWNGAEDPKETSIVSFSDGKPMLETVRLYRSQDEAVTVGKVIGNRKMSEEEIKELVESEKRMVGPLDGFISKRGKRYSAVIRLEEKSEGKWGISFVFDDGLAAATDADGKLDLSEFPVVGTIPGTSFKVHATPNSYVSENHPGDQSSSPETFRLGRMMLGKEVPEEEVKNLLTKRKTGLIKGFRSRRTNRLFDAHLVLQDTGKIGFEFPPRPPKKASKKAAKKAARKSAAKSGS